MWVGDSRWFSAPAYDDVFIASLPVEDDLRLPLVGGLSVHRPERVGDAVWRESRVCADGSVDRYRSDAYSGGLNLVGQREGQRALGGFGYRQGPGSGAGIERDASRR
jgi:hypothetical protein